MKIFKTAAILMVAIAGLASCSKDDNGGSKAVYEDATLGITLVSPNTRAVGTPASTDDQITDVNIFIVDASGEINTSWSTYVSSLSTGTHTETISVTTSASNVYVIANAGADLTTTITTKALLDGDYIIDMANSGQDQFTSRWATGSAAIPAFAQNGSGDWESTVSVTANFVAARITVEIDNQMSGPSTGYTGMQPDLVLTDVAILQARHQSKLFGSSLVAELKGTGSYWSGIYDITKWEGGYHASMVDPITFDAVSETFPDKYYYYVFENDADAAADYPTIVTLRGTLGTNGVDEYDIYYPVHLASYETPSSGTAPTGVERGKSYDIKFIMKVDPTDPNGGGGTTDPGTPLVNADVDVVIDINDWIPVALEKEFN